MEKHFERFKSGFVPFIIVVIGVFLYLVLSAINNFYETNLVISLPAIIVKIITVPVTIYLVGLWLEKKSLKSDIKK
jgi:ABC-type tungstate transport system substrate-binding protein